MNNEQVNIAVIGAGWWSCFSHIPGLKKCGVKNMFIANRTDRKFEKIKQEFNEIEHFYTDINEMLDKHEVHGAIICSPHTAHFDNAEKVLKRGIPALIDKPMTTSLEDAKKLVQLAKENNTHIMIPHGLNFTPSARKAKDLIKKIGKIEHISVQVGSALLDLFTAQELQGTEDHLFRPPAETWADPQNSGGYGWGQLVHLLGLLFLLVNDDPHKISAFTTNSSSGVDMYDAVAGKMKSGATISISGAGSVPKTQDFQNDIRIFGEKGMFVFDLEDKRERLAVFFHSGDIETIDIGRSDCAYDGESPIEPFVNLCKNSSSENLADGIVGLRSIAVLDSMYKSAKSEKVVEVKL